MKPMHWTPEMIDRAIELREVGVTPHKIGVKMGVPGSSVCAKLSRMGVSTKNTPQQKSDIDKGQHMHELARVGLTIDEAAEVLDISVSEAFSLAMWYEVRFDGSPIDTTMMLMLNNRGHKAGDIAKVMGFSPQKVAAVLKAKKRQGLA